MGVKNGCNQGPQPAAAHDKLLMKPVRHLRRVVGGGGDGGGGVEEIGEREEGSM